MSIQIDPPGEAGSFTVRTKSRADTMAVLDFVRSAIENAQLTAGARLPTERELADRFGASRNSIRKALRALEDEGLIYRHVGKGTFVAGIPSGSSSDEPASWRRTSPAQLMEARMIVELQFPELYAAHATQEDIDRLRFCLRRGKEATTWAEFERWDEAFHEAIAEGTKNLLLVQFYRSVTEVRRQAAWGRMKAQAFTDSHRRKVEREHTAVVAALEDRDQQRARQCLLDHLLSVRKEMLGY